MRLLIIFGSILLGSIGLGQVLLPFEERRNGPLVKEALSPVQKVLQESSAVFYNKETRTPFIYGVVMSEEGWILTKASELEQVPEFTLRVGRRHFKDVEVVGSDFAHDVALVKVDPGEKPLVPVRWVKSADPVYGTWVVSNGSTRRRERRVRLGNISAKKREIKGPVLVVLGIGLKKEDEGLKVTTISDESGLKEVGLETGDVLKKIEGTEVPDMETLANLLREKEAGDEVGLEVMREGEMLVFPAVLKARDEVYEERLTRNDSMSGRTSKRRTNFPMVIQHDTTSDARSMGGPVVLFDGKAVGMNIACASRVEVYALPAEVVRGVFEELRGE